MKIPPAVLIGGAGAIIAWLRSQNKGVQAVEQALLEGLGQGIEAQATQFSNPAARAAAESAARLAHMRAQQAARGQGLIRRLHRIAPPQAPPQQQTPNPGSIIDADFTIIDEDDPV